MRADPRLPVTFQVNTRSPPPLRNPASDLSLPEGNEPVKHLFFCPLLRFICLGHVISLCAAHLSDVPACLPPCDPPIHVCISMSSLSSGTHKPKDPPWLALVQSEHKKKKAPAPPPAGQAAVPNTGSAPSLKGGDSRPSTPPSPANPFDEDEDEGEESSTVEEERGEGASIPATAAAGHPWYSITQAAEATGADAPPSAGSSSRSASPGGAKSKKRPAPRAPQPAAGTQNHPTTGITPDPPSVITVC